MSRPESVVFARGILISFGFSDLPRAPAPSCDHGLQMFDTKFFETTT